MTKAKIAESVIAAADPSGIYRKCLERYPGLFLNTTQAAEVLGVTRQEVAYLCRVGAFPNMPVRHSSASKWRVPKVSLLMYLNGIAELPPADRSEG